MAPPINPFKLMGKIALGSPSKPGKSKGKGKVKDTGTGKKGKKPIFQVNAPKHPTPSANSGSADQELLRPLPIIHEIDESYHGEDLASRRKTARLEVVFEPTQGNSSQFQA
jgi:hypothetical protein